MNHMFKQKLNLTHTAEVLALSNEHDTHMGFPKQPGEFQEDFWLPFLDPQDKIHQLIGVRDTEDGELLGMMGLYLWTGFPHYTITGFTLKPGLHPYSYILNPALVALWDTALVNMERIGRTKFYMLKNNKWRTTKMLKQWHRYVGKGRYSLSIDEVIPANTESRWIGYANMMAGKTYPVDTHIMCGTFIDEKLNGKIL